MVSVCRSCCSSWRTWYSDSHTVWVSNSATPDTLCPHTSESSSFLLPPPTHRLLFPHNHTFIMWHLLCRSLLLTEELGHMHQVTVHLPCNINISALSYQLESLTLDPDLCAPLRQRNWHWIQISLHRDKEILKPTQNSTNSFLTDEFERPGINFYRDLM